MNTTPPLTRREHAALAILQSLVSYSGSLEHGDIPASVKFADNFLAELDRTNPVPVSPEPETQTDLPPGVPAPPEGCVFYGKGPLKVLAYGAERADVYAFDPCFSEDEWDTYTEGALSGCSRGFYYALRRGTPIARANGIPDQDDPAPVSPPEPLSGTHPIRTWREQLPPGIRDRALANRESVPLKGHPVAHNIQGAIIRGFPWSSSPEGSDFWNSVYAAARDNTPYPPLP